MDDSAYMRASVGVSLFWKTPIGPIRLNFSRPVVKKDYDKTQNFDISVATKF